MARKFNRIYEWAHKPEHLITADMAKDSFVLLSDQHKGDGSNADDFKENAALYNQALSYYEERNFKLINLGDSEECWENTYDRILTQYERIIKKEIDLAITAPQQNKLRIWGNHDKELSLRRFKRYYKKLGTALLDGVIYREGLCLGPDIFLIHGHQGRFFEDIAWKVSRLAVKFIWKSLQKLFLIGKEGPSENLRLREDLELNYYRWAKKKRLLLICGHTHRALFASLTHLDRLEREILELRGKKETEKTIAQKTADHERIVSRRQGLPRPFFEKPPKEPVPCYFNTGCCCYANGITCLEIEKGLIRLIKWQRRTGERIILAEESIEKILTAIKKGWLLKDEPGEVYNSLDSIS
jgi:UDP-2,3-diacylglucosamine pyrophosphatase LpxH